MKFLTITLTAAAPHPITGPGDAAASPVPAGTLT
jgi:hypothetical protein